MPKLEILSGKREGDVVDLSDEGLDIGNRKTAKLSIRDPWISWNHAKIVFEDGRFVIEDLGSSNGTTVNGRKVTRQPLQAFDEILLGKTKIRFVEADGQAPPAAMTDEVAGQTMRLNRGDMGFSPAGMFEASEKMSTLERERDELKKKLDVLERFLDLPADERPSSSFLRTPRRPPRPRRRGRTPSRR
jgi:predicted component of type VI protein secretion system